jgi:hypothetical protein
MRKLRLQMQISVDGFVYLNGEEDWMGGEIPNIGNSSTIWRMAQILSLLAERWQAFIPHFENFEEENPKIEFAQKMVNTLKSFLVKPLMLHLGKIPL